MSLLHEMLKKHSSEPLVLDGSKGALSLKRMSRSNLTHADDLPRVDPRFVRRVHDRYLRADSDIIQTFTFQMNGRSRQDLDPTTIFENNRRATELARQSVKNRVALIAASIGPLAGEFIEESSRIPRSPMFFPHQMAVDLYTTQMAGCIAGGADALCIETINDYQSAVAALTAAKQAQSIMGSHLPLIISMNFDAQRKSGWTTPHGVTPDMLKELTDQHAEVAAIGANCGSGFASAESLTEQFRLARPKRAIIWLKLNAGKPQAQLDGTAKYDMATSKHAREYALTAFRSGAMAIGGCCGTTPRLIQAMRQALE